MSLTKTSNRVSLVDMKGYSVYSGFSQGYTRLPVSTRAAVRRQNTEHPRPLHQPYTPTLQSVLTRKHITKVDLLSNTGVSINIMYDDTITCAALYATSCPKRFRNASPVLNINQFTSANRHKKIPANQKITGRCEPYITLCLFANYITYGFKLSYRITYIEQ